MLSRAEAIALYPPAGFIQGNAFVPAGKRDTFRVLDPATGHTLGHFPVVTADDVVATTAAAQRGFDAWRTMAPPERAAILLRAATNIESRREQLAALVTLELGKPQRESLVEAQTAADIFRWAAGEAQRIYGLQIPARELSSWQLTFLEPVGPVAAFASWNAPLITPARKLSTALAAGCSIILKAAEETPASALALAQCAVDAGLPDGVVSVVFGNPPTLSEQLISSPVIRAVSFTGSISVGRHVAARAAHFLKRSVMELGGHAPVLVFDDADLDRIIGPAVTAKYRNAGQVCTAPTRFLVQESIYATFVTAFSAAARSLRVGDGFDPATQIGPLAHPRRALFMEELVQDARQHGMAVTAGGRRDAQGGCYFEPTVLSGPEGSARVQCEEPFGPIATVTPFSSVDDALRLANSLPVGLASYVMTRSLDTARVVARRLEAGSVNVNGWRASLPETPFGGCKDSGFGREGGVDGVRAFLDTKFVTLT